MNGDHHEHPKHEPGPDAATVDEEEMRARLEEELKKITVRDVLVQTIVTLINLGGQRLGISEATEDVGDLDQTRVAIEAVRSLLPLLEADERSAEQLRPVRDALAQLQMAYAHQAGAAGGSPKEAGARPEGGAEPQVAPEGPTAPKPKPSGRLWVPPGTKS